MEEKLRKLYYSPRGYWKGLAAIKKLAAAAGVSEDAAKGWLKGQAIWQIYLPPPRRIPRPKFGVTVPNEVHQADLLFLPHDRVGRKTYKNMRSPSLTQPLAIKTQSPWPQRKPKRSRPPLKRFTGGAPSDGHSCYRLILGASSWAQ